MLSQDCIDISKHLLGQPPCNVSEVRRLNHLWPYAGTQKVFQFADPLDETQFRIDFVNYGDQDFFRAKGQARARNGLAQ